MRIVIALQHTGWMLARNVIELFEKIMLDRDLAEMYQVETRILNQAVKRNIERFPPDFMFLLTEKEMKYWKSQIVISNSENMGLRRKPYALAFVQDTKLAS